MDTVLLFRKRTPLTEDGLPWLRGAEEHPWTARRNASGKGVVSAILVRALLTPRAPRQRRGALALNARLCRRMLAIVIGLFVFWPSPSSSAVHQRTGLHNPKGAPRIW